MARDTLLLTWLALVFMTSCFFKEEKKKPPQAPPAEIPAAFPSRGMQGILSRVTLHHGVPQVGEIPLTLRIAPPYLTLAFPSNGLLAGAEIRLGPSECAVVDSTTRRLTSVPLSRLSAFLGLLPRGTLWKAVVQDIRSDGEERLWKIRFEGKRGTRLLSLREGPGEDPGGLMRTLVFRPVGKVPSVASEIRQPLAFTWTFLEGGRKGEIHWKVMSNSPARFTRNELMPDLPGYTRVTLAQLLSGYARNTIVSQNAIHLVSRRSSGVVYLNGRVMDFISPGNDIHLPLTKGGTISVFPLFGGVPLVDRHMKIPLKWTIQ